MASLNHEADKFLRFYNQLENKLMDDGSVEAHAPPGILEITSRFLMSLENRIHENDKNRDLLFQAARDFPRRVTDAVEHMPEMGRKLCRAIAEGIAQCLTDGLWAPERLLGFIKV